VGSSKQAVERLESVPGRGSSNEPPRGGRT